MKKLIFILGLLVFISNPFLAQTDTNENRIIDSSIIEPSPEDDEQTQTAEIQEVAPADIQQEEIEEETFNNVAARLQIQKREALWWRDSGYLYFKTFSNMPLPEGLTPPTRSLEEVKALEKIYHLR